MTTCRLDPETLTLYCSGDLSPEEVREVEAHLGSCPACARERGEIEAALGLLDPAKAYPREAEVDWDRFAAETLARVGGAPAGRVLPFRRRVAALARPANLARAAIVLLAVGLGVVLMTREEPRQATQELAEAGATMPEDFRHRLEFNLAKNDTREYLQESRQVLLSVLEVPVRCSKDGIDISAERAKSRNLLRRKRLLQDDLARPELARAADLCNRLEGVLTEISTLDGCADRERIQQLREAVRRGQLLVKIGVIEGELEGFSA